MNQRRNVTATRDTVGGYTLSDTKGVAVVYLTGDQWHRLGLKPLAKGAVWRIDLQLSGVPRKPRTKRKKP